MAGALRSFQRSLCSWSLDFELREELGDVLGANVDAVKGRGRLLSSPRRLFLDPASDPGGETKNEKHQTEAGARNAAASTASSSDRTSSAARITGERRIYD